MLSDSPQPAMAAVAMAPASTRVEAVEE
jgi:hypothetical protein